MKRLAIALAAALAFPLAAQEGIWERPARMMPPEKLDELVRAVAESSPAESGDAWLFTVVSEKSQVSSIINEETESLSAVVVSSPAREYKKNSDAAFGAGVAAGRLLETAASHPMLQAEMFAPPDELGSELKEELGIPRENRIVAVVLVAEKAEPRFGLGVGSMEAFSGDEGDLDPRGFVSSSEASGFAPNPEASAFARGPEHRRPERGMRPPRGFGEGDLDPRGYGEREGEYRGFAPNPDASGFEPNSEASAFARRPEGHRHERGMRPPRGFGEREGDARGFEPNSEASAFARGPEGHRPDRGMRPPHGFGEFGY